MLSARKNGSGEGYNIRLDEGCRLVARSQVQGEGS